MTVVTYQDTAVVDKPWDGGAAEKALDPVNVANGNTLYTWRDGSADPTNKSSWKLPHHEVVNGKGGAANVNGCRNALSRLPQATGIPSSDFDGIRSHLNRHITKFNNSKSGETNEADLQLRAFLAADVEMRCWAAREELAIVFGDLGRTMQLDQVAGDIGALLSAQSEPFQKQGSIATIGLQGVISPQPSLISILFGGDPGGLSGFAKSLSAAAADPEVKAIVLDVDSPGGLVDQVPETAALIRAARESKPIVAVANTMAASAAYWLASQANEVVVTPSGEVGSIGVYSIHMDRSGMLSQMGVSPTIVRAGKYKAEGNPYQPLTEDAQSNMQAQIDDFYEMFTADVAKGRGVGQRTVEANYGQGRTLLAQKAVDAGMADRVATLGDTITRLQSSNPRVRRTRAENESDLVTLDEARARLGLAENGDDPPEPAATVADMTSELEAIAAPADAKPPLSEEETGRLLDTLAQLRGAN